MKKMRLLSLAVAAVMICAIFSGCSIFGSKTVMKVGGEKISEEIYTAAIAQVDMFMQQNSGFSFASMLDIDLGDGKTGADYVKENADGFIKEFASVRVMAKNNGITLTAEDKKALSEDKKAQIEAAGGRKAFVEALAQNGVNEAFYDYVTESQMLYTRLYEKLFTGEGELVPSAEDIAGACADYLCVKHVLIQAKEEDADFAEKKAKAEDVARRAKAGEDFDALIAEFGEDPGMESNKGGYIMDATGVTPSGSSMVTEFATASAALGVNGVSDIVKSSYGFHIIKRYPLTAEYIATDLEGFRNQFSSVFFSQEIMKVMESLEVEYTAAYEEIDVHKVFGEEESFGLEVEESHEGHDHEAEEGTAEELPEITLTPAE